MQAKVIILETDQGLTEDGLREKQQENTRNKPINISNLDRAISLKGF
jgi:hypothetical protein